MAALLALDVAAFLLEKVAANRGHGEGWAYYWSLVKAPWMWGALAIGPLQLWTWTRILARLDISLAYPMSALSTPMTLLAAVLLLGEHLHWQVWLGAALVTLAVVILGDDRGHTKENLATDGHR
jgi:drug/metabolite transporter (DMT)-like permease